jgi:hypothetical protein
MAHALCCR